MLPLTLGEGVDGGLRVLALGAHSDDVELGAGGTLLSLAGAGLICEATVVVLSGEGVRAAEAECSAAALFSGVPTTVDVHQLLDGRFPEQWPAVKDKLQQLAAACKPDIIFAPSPADRHQDHRVLGELVPTAFRDHLVLRYEIPKWDGDLAEPTVYVPLAPETLARKIDLLRTQFPSQQSRDWFDEEVFRGLARLRGMQCRAQYAEAFTCDKAVWTL